MEKEGFFNPGSIVEIQNATDKFHAISQIIDKTGVFKSIKNKEAFIAAVFNREKLQTTSMGHGIGVAHGKTEQVPDVKIALGYIPQGIDYHSHDGKPVHFLFVVASNPYKQSEYIKSLSLIAKTFIANSCKKELTHDCGKIALTLQNIFKKEYCFKSA